MDTTLAADQRADLLLAQMTLDEKIATVHCVSGSYVNNLSGNTRLGIPALHLQDGPAGIAGGVANVTAFPAPIAVAASWDIALARQYGVMLGTEAHGKGVHVLLGPMMNMVRVPQAGRNFESFGEDPYLSSAMAAADIQGIQSQRVIAMAKHFVCNEQETDRNIASSDVDERTQQEIYYPPFYASVRAGVGSVMGSYNRVNDRFACESEALATVLKKMWGFDGFVMSDYKAKFTTVTGVNNGLDIENPYDTQFGAALKTAIQSGDVPAARLDDMVHRILATMFRFGVFDDPTGNLSSNVTSTAHAQFARDAAAQSIVLLKNSGNLLPLNTSTFHSIAVIGSAASVNPISIGGGSAQVVLPYQITPLSAISSRAGAGVSIVYNQGDGGYVSQAVQIAQQSDVAVVCVGQRTSEGADRTSLSLPNDQDALVSAVAAANPHTIVVMYTEAGTLMPWAGQVAAALVAWYPGQENGNALASVLFGDVNPSGKLPVTFPAAGNQIPANSSAQFPGVNGHVSYSEQLQMGYRWYDANNVPPLFPFGHGLSYSTFAYSNLTVGAANPSGQVRIELDVENTGSRTGAEVVQLYLGLPSAAGEPPKQLKGFRKISLAPSETAHVTFTPTWEDLACWDAVAHGWVVPLGTFQVMVGSSSRDIRLTGSFTISSSVPPSDPANNALHHPVTVSSSLAANYPGAAAVDGDPATSWISLAGDPQSIAVDLGVTREISRVRLNWDTNYAASYQLLVSDDNTNWTSFYNTTTGAGGTEDLVVTATGRFVQMHAMQGSPSAGCALRELEVYSPSQRPFGDTVRNLPNRIEAEDYDIGGEGVGYHATTPGNDGGGYRSDGVNIQPTTNTGGGYSVGPVAAGDWLEYTVAAPNPAAIYSIRVRVASPLGSGQMRVRLIGTVLGTFTIPNTGGDQNWQTLTLPNVVVFGGSGSQVLRLEILSGGFILNWVEFSRATVCDPVNVALNRPATSSSIQSTSYLTNYAFDGNPRTRWSSLFSDPQWISVDLGTTTQISRVRLDWENAYAKSYRIQLSNDGNTWSDAYTTTNGTGSINDLAVSGSGRFVRMYGTQRGTQSGYSLWGFEVYGGNPTSPPSAPTDLTATPGHSQVALSWIAALGATNYNVKRATVSGGPYAMVATGVTTTNYTDLFLTNGVTCYYVVSAVNDWGESLDSLEAGAIPAMTFAQWQMQYFGCTNCPQAAATADPDGDGQHNLMEFLAGFDPTNGISCWHIQGSPANGDWPLTVSFTDNATASLITNRCWDFGDGGTGSGTNPSHTYTNTGTFSVGFTILNLDGAATLVASNLITVSPPRGFWPAMINAGPIAYWRLNETNGVSVAADFLGFHNGTISVSVTPGVSGPQSPLFPGFETTNTAMQFNYTTGSYLIMPALNLNTNTVTITGWINPTGAQAGWTGLAFCRGGSTCAGLHFGPGSIANELRYTWNNSRWDKSTGLVAPTGQWSFVALVVTSTNATIYLGTNGVLNSFTDVSSEPNQAFDASLLIGYDPSEGSRLFRGLIDEVAICNHSLTPTQIQQLYNSALTVPPPPLTPLQTWQIQYFGCTGCPQAQPDADPLGKGMSNTNQFLAGLNPTNPASLFRIISAVPQSNDVAITWTTAGAHTNAVQATAGDANGGYSTNFADISGPIILQGTGDVTTNYLNVGAATNSLSRYYRVRLVP
jgi:beta-glucosidase